MAENSRYASRRSDDVQPRGGPSAPIGGPRASNDPLAELARLIGRDDPFAELRRNIGPARPRSEQAAPPRRDPPAPEWLGRQRAAPADEPVHDAADGYDEPHVDVSDAAQWRANRYRDEVGREQPDPYHPQDHYADEPADHHHPADPAAHHYAQSGYDARHDEVPPVAGDYASETDYADEHAVADGEEGYQAPRERRRSGFTTIAAVVGLIVLLVGGAFAYRALSGRIGSGPPPVISADASPSKVVPAAQADGQPNKLIYDRVADKGQNSGELVSREEQPVDVRSVAPRVVFPGAPTPTVAAPATVPSAAAPAAGSEPRKVKTLTIRPDQTASADTPDASSPWPAPPAARAVTTTTLPAQAQPPTTRSVSRPAAPPSAASMTIGSQSASADAAETPARTAAIAQPIRAPEAGGYVVQLFSGKSETEAQDQFRALQTKYQGVLGGRQPIIRRADLGEKGVYYRAQVGPFATIDQANQFCGNLKSAGGQCIVQRN